MARSLGLSAYLAFARREAPALRDFERARPDGEVVWLHSSDPARATSLAQIGLRLVAQRGGVRLILTAPPDNPLPETVPDGVIIAECPSENPADIQAFLSHWKPDSCIWLDPWLRPGLISATHAAGIPLIFVDAREPALQNRRWRFVPEPIKGTLPLFTSILAHSEDAAIRLRRLATLGDKLVPSGPLIEDCQALPCNETDLEELGPALGGRPVWLAARLQPDELGTVLQAHRSVVRLSHRTLLVIVPDNPQDATALREKCKAEGWRCASWDDGEMPDPNTQILISEDTRELGLWYRVAPVTLMGSSLVSGFGGRNPLEPAALGSAILYGPGVRNYLDSYSRLAKAGAARIVKDVDALVTALGLISAPDEAAAMAHAGWEVVSEGAEVADQIVGLVQDALDLRGGR